MHEACDDTQADPRLVKLEEKLMHLEQTVEALDALVLELNRENAALKSTVSRLTQRMAKLEDGAADPTADTDPAAHRPPHW